MKRVYLHYPFCQTHCYYCNFAAGAPPKEEFIIPYHEALLKEIQYYKQLFNFSEIAEQSFYFGGGTPSLMPEKLLEEIFYHIPIHKQTEVSLEINPETVTKEKARFWKEIGFNRVSLGWQSMNDRTLKFLGRSGTSTDNQKSFDLLREAGFDNISVDRILSVKDDTDIEFFNAISTLKPDHVSTYQLSIEEKTVLYSWTQNHKYLPLSDEKALRIEEQTDSLLSELGYVRYETSNYSRSIQKQGHHNLGYWNYEHWLGLGAGASGFVPNEEFGLRYRNHFSFKDYILNPLTKEESESINFNTAIREALMLGIRKRTGIDKHLFEQKFSISWNQLFSQSYSQDFFDETETHLILKKEMIPLTNPAILNLWESLNIEE